MFEMVLRSLVSTTSRRFVYVMKEFISERPDKRLEDVTKDADDDFSLRGASREVSKPVWGLRVFGARI
jgi:hypothetical protein